MLWGVATADAQLCTTGGGGLEQGQEHVWDGGLDCDNIGQNGVARGWTMLTALRWPDA